MVIHNLCIIIMQRIRPGSHQTKPSYCLCYNITELWLNWLFWLAVDQGGGGGQVLAVSASLWLCPHCSTCVNIILSIMLINKYCPPRVVSRNLGNPPAYAPDWYIWYHHMVSSYGIILCTICTIWIPWSKTLSQSKQHTHFRRSKNCTTCSVL